MVVNHNICYEMSEGYFPLKNHSVRLVFHLGYNAKGNKQGQVISMQKRRLFLTILAVLLALLIIAGVVLTSQWNKPLGQTVVLATRTPTSAPTEATPAQTQEAPTAGTQPTQTEEPTNAPTLTPTFTAEPQPVCGSDRLKYYLVAGIGDRDNQYMYGLADVVRIVRVDFVKPEVSVLTLPRDMLVQFTDVVDPNGVPLVQGKLNQAWFFGSPGKNYFKGEGYGPGLMAQTIANNFDLYVDHYGALNMQIFIDLIDAMGGVDIYLPEFVDGRPIGEESFDLDKSQGFFDAGWNHMNGQDALSFVRIRARYGEVKRTDNQTLLICAIKDQISDPSIIKTIPKLVSSFIENTQTDLSLKQISDLLCLLPKLNGNNLKFFHIPMKDKYNPDGLLEASLAEIAQVEGQSYVYTYDSAKLKAFIDEFEAGTLEPIKGTGKSTCPENPPKP